MIKIQNLTTPILKNIKTFDIKNGERIGFDVVGGNRIEANNLVIERVSDGVSVYNETQYSFNFTHELPPVSLANGVNYRAKIRTKGRGNVWSSYSPSVLFWCFSSPRLYIENIRYDDQNRIYNQTWLFETSYRQAESEILQSYRYILYNSNKELIKTFSEIFTDGKKNLVQEITGLKNDELYYLEVITLSPNGNSGSTGLIHFRPFYIAPNLVVAITPKAIPEEGAIKISANLVQIIMKLYDGDGKEIHPSNVEYKDGQYLDMNREDYSKLVADQGFDIFSSDFILKMWLKNIPDETGLISLFNNIGSIDFFRKADRIMAYKKMNNLDIKDYYASNSFATGELDDIMIEVIQKDNVLEIKVEVL